MLKVGIIGFGKIARRMYVPHIASSPDARLMAVADSSEACLAEAKANYAVPNVFKDYTDMLENIDVVCVCAPNFLHAPIAVEVLAHGKPVLVEKPMAMTLDEGKKMVEAARKANVILMVNQSQRFSPLFQRAKEVMDSGILGKVVGVRSVFGHAGPKWWSPESTWFFSKKDAGFGTLADLGIHRVDMIRYLTGLEFEEVFSAVSHMREGEGDVEDNAVILGKLQGGALATVTVSWTIHGRVESTMDIYGEKGTLKINYEGGRVLFADLEHPISDSSLSFEVPYPYEPVYEQGQWRFFSGIDNFINAVLGKAKCVVPGEEGLKSLEVVLAAAKAAETNRAVRLPL